VTDGRHAVATTGHIAFLSPRFAEGSMVGGAEALLKELAVQAAGMGYKVTFLATCARNHFTWANELSPGRRQVDGLDVVLFPVDEDRDVGAFLRVQESISVGRSITEHEERVWLENSVNSSALCRYLGDSVGEFDRVVMGPYLFGLVYSAARVSPEKTLLVPCLHDEPFAYLRVFREMFGSVGGFLFNSEPERDLACRLFGLDPDGLSVVGKGIEAFDADQTAFAVRRKISAPYVLFCGRREGMKGVPLLLDYMAAFRSRTGRDVKLVLTGSGEVDIPSELVRHVIDCGYLSVEEMHEAMAGALVFCHPSLNESFGIVLLESWMARTPALVHAKSVVLRYQCLRSGAGLWFKSYPEFEEELILLLDDRKQRDALGNAGREYVLNEYSWEKIRPKLKEALEK
jgi:glycosyltransferase involved in cell wall biosynthesis